MRIMLHGINYIYIISKCRVLLKGRTKDIETDMTTCVDMITIHRFPSIQTNNM